MVDEVGTLGEFALIDRLRARLGDPTDERLIVGIGDDAAVWRGRDGYLIATTDTMVAGVHFLPERCSWRDVGWKALAVNVSDVAAMGGVPSFALVTLCLPPDMQATSLDQLYSGLHECAEAYGVTVAGGDVVRAEQFSITVALAGEARAEDGGRPLILRRDAARPGDLIAVTGPLGGSAAGLLVLQRAPSVTAGIATGPPDGAARFVLRHMRPVPRIDAGDIAVRAGIRCGVDISDGLAQDLAHICEASGVDAELRLDDVPLEPGLADIYRGDARVLAATGGEDYELLLVGGDGALQIADGALRAHVSTPDTPQLTVIGRITGAGSGRVRVIDRKGAEVVLPRRGWDHLAQDTRA
jgi:thiamine-monophosphate kinase